MKRVKMYNRRRPTAEELWGRLDTLYTAHMKQEAPPSNTDSGAAGSDHFTLASPNAGQRRAGNQPLWWEWASNNGFVSGKFRTLYGGTPHPSPSQKPAAPHPNRRRAGQRSSLDLGMTVGVGTTLGHCEGTILPFSRSAFCFFHSHAREEIKYFSIYSRAWLWCCEALACSRGLCVPSCAAPSLVLRSAMHVLAAVSLPACSGRYAGGSY